MPEGILRTKLFPPLQRPNQVTRRSLLDKFIQARKRGVTCALVSAPAGFGKTTIAADCARASGCSFAWLALEEGDNNLLRFWRYVDAALETVDSRIGEGLRPALYAAQTPAIQQIVTGLVNDIAELEAELILALDDYHLIELPAIHDSLNYLLDHLPPQMCLVIITRSDPPLNLARRRGRGQLLEIRATDLRFTPDETATFLNETMLLGLTEADIVSLGQRTEGWIAGLQMAALSMQDDTDPHHFVTAFNGDDHHIADYLVEEVLSRQLVEVQRFLLQTSILDRLNAPLCDAVTDRADSRAMLNTLERANLFILPLDNRREWFRYHHLFSELLCQRLRQTSSEEAIIGLHRAASGWFEAQGDIASAIRHARDASDDRAILGLLQRNADKFFFSGELPQLYEFANLLPLELRKEAPRLCMAVSWAGLASNHPAEVPAWLEQVETHFKISAERALDDPNLDIATRAALLEVLIIRLQFPPTRTPDEHRAHILAIRDQLNALPAEQVSLFNVVFNLRPVVIFNLGLFAEDTGDLPLAAQMFTEAIPLCHQTKNATLFHLATAHLANIQFMQGQLGAAEQTHAQALAEADSFSRPSSPLIALNHAGIGTVRYEWNDLAAASRHFSEGLVRARLWTQWESLFSLALGRAYIKQRAGETQAAIDILNEVDSPPTPGMELPLRAYAALLGGSDSALVWLAAHPTESSPEPNPANEFLALTIVRLLASVRRTDEAIALLQKIIHFAESGERVTTLIQSKVALAVVAGQAETLMEALALAEPEGYLSTFLIEGEPMSNLLQLVLRQPNLDPRIAAYARSVLAGFDRASRKPKQSTALVEPLTERELEVLRYIAEGLSNPEIASRLYLSTNTLKAHTQNIFMKLDVHNRVQAASKAKKLGLIE